MNQEFISHSPDETISWARQFSASLKPGDVICLYGDLGAGKTTLVRGIAQGLGLSQEEHVTSPTFVIMHRYTCRIPLYHFDCYRMNSLDDLIAVGFEEFIYSGGGVACVEWPERAGNLIPEGKISITLSHLGERARRIVVERG